MRTALHHASASGLGKPIGLYRPYIGSSNLMGEAARRPERILIVGTDTSFQGSLALALREAGFEVMTATTGERAFCLLRDWQRPIDWLYTQATLPGLIDGWILADQYRDNHPGRPAIIGTREVRSSLQGDVVLKEPTVETVLDTVRHLTVSARSQTLVEPASTAPQSLAA
ncbi:hypothetical protein [Microvirga zambiensis]|uniref:hypothetical protein n=1 Tax=Microvirga zambiensis TaxID=1402137 RepID=UPI00191F0E9B|nr:hypothetical protein [Microvirga zambiensis]